MEKKKKHSLTSLNKDGVIIRRDVGYFIRHKDLSTVWNARDHDERWERKIQKLTDYLREGGKVPPLEIRVNEHTGAVEIVDGHRRHEAYGRLIEEGAPEGFIQIVPFEGGDAARLARIATSNNQEELRPMEKANLYSKLAGINLTPDQIAKIVHKSITHINDYLLLAYANHDVQSMVRLETASAETAIKTIRDHGENAGKILQEVLQKQGGRKVTPGAMKGKSLPSKIQAPYIASADTLAASFGSEVHARLYHFTQLKKERGEEIADDETVAVEISVKALSEFLESHGNAEAARQKQLVKQREREAKAAQCELEEADQ